MPRRSTRRAATGCRRTPRRRVGMAGQLHPAGVAHSAQCGPIGDRQLQQRRRQRGDQAAVGHQHHRPLGFVCPPLGLVGDQLRDQTAFRAPPRRRGSRRRAAPTSRRCATPAALRAPSRPPRVRHALPIAEVRLAQPGVHLHRQAGPLAERHRGVERAPQVRRDDQQRLPFGQHLGGRDGLVAAEVAQVGVELTLHAVGRVVFGLPVPQHDQAADPHGAGSRSIDGTIGQSRHNRSSA